MKIKKATGFMINADVGDRNSWRQFVTCYTLFGFVGFGPIEWQMRFLEKYNYSSRDQTDEILSFASYVPGSVSVKLVYLSAMENFGVVAAVLATFLFLLPSSCVLFAIGYVGNVYKDSQLFFTYYLSSIQIGLGCAVIVILACESWFLASSLCVHRTSKIIFMLGLLMALWYLGYWYTYPVCFGICALLAFMYFSGNSPLTHFIRPVPKASFWVWLI